jgi:hypothetical protein
MPKEMVEIADVLNNVKTDLSELEVINGQLTIESKPDKGTTFIITSTGFLVFVFFGDPK